MSNIFKGLNEVNPHNYDSDIDYYNALNKPRRSRSEDDYVEPQDNEPVAFQQKPDARPEYNITKDEDRQAGYNMIVTVKAPTTQKAQWSLESYIDHNWGAKKLIGKITPIADGVVQAHMIDKHKYGMWKPWKDEPPISKPISFGENKEADYGADYQSMVKRVGQKAKEGPRKTVWDPVKRVYKTVPAKQSAIGQGVAEGTEFGSKYAEQLAQQVFNHNPNIKDENQVLNLGYNISKSDLGSRAQGIFRDEDFPSDFVSAYFYLQKEGVAENVDIGKEWMSDTELDQYVPDALEQEWRELVGYNEDGNAHPLWINMTGDYEPRSSDPQHRAWMVKVANKWFAKKKIPNVKFFDVRDHDTEDELEWLVQIGPQGVAEGKMAELEMDLEDPEITDRQFEKMYGMTRAEAREQFSQTDMWAFPDIRNPNRPLHEIGMAEGGDVPQWRVEQSDATGRYYVVTGYTSKSRRVWKNKQGAGDFNKRADAEAKAQELNQGVAEGVDNLLRKYYRNENDNLHSENVVLLAQHFGTPSELRMAKQALAYRNEQGGFDYSDPKAKKYLMFQQEINKKYYPLLKRQGVAEGSNDTVYPNAEVIKSKNGKPVGEIYQDGNEWGCFHYKADRGYDMIDSREEAIEALKDLHQETGRNRPDYTIKGVAEVSDATLTSYLTKVDADSQKHDKDPSKRSPEKRNKSVAGFSRAFNKLDARKEKTDLEEKINFEESFDMKIEELEMVNEDWQKVNKKDKTDGMSKKAVKAYRRENPGSKLKTAVTTKPSKLKKGSKSAKRRKSFCARMSGMKKAHASAKTKRDPDSPINKALRRWNCESVEQMRELVMIAEQKIQKLREAANPAHMKKKGQKPKSMKENRDTCTVCGQTPCNCTH